ncbi:DUF2933 domain-containing protein [Streptomyces sp. NPDC012693]|uniref:DUF2933 domain-containing protein n=1 Tax=Streptomyces sp. NPDC012693 TaxID=3364844 RepID=UPI0036A7C0DF
MEQTCSGPRGCPKAPLAILSVALACPLMMFFMMRGKHDSGRQVRGASQQPRDQDPQARRLPVVGHDPVPLPEQGRPARVGSHAPGHLLRMLHRHGQPDARPLKVVRQQPDLTPQPLQLGRARRP